MLHAIGLSQATGPIWPFAKRVVLSAKGLRKVRYVGVFRNSDHPHPNQQDENAGGALETAGVEFIPAKPDPLGSVVSKRQWAS